MKIHKPHILRYPDLRAAAVFIADWQVRIVGIGPYKLVLYRLEDTADNRERAHRITITERER